LVVDDQSDDDSEEVLRAYHLKDHKFRFYVRDRQPKGAPTCRNIGLKHAKGDYVIFLDSDDYLLPFCLEQRVLAINEHPECDFMVFPMGKKENNTIAKIDIPCYDDYLVPFLSANLPWSIMCPIWKRNFLVELEGFTEGYPRFNDPELMIRALLEPQVRFKVFNENEYDTVFIPNKKLVDVHSEKVYRSLRRFIPDIIKKLRINRTGYIKYLALYLHLWFKYFYISAPNPNVIFSFKLIFMFYWQGVISMNKAISMLTRVFIFSASRIILKSPINKLSEKSIYLS
jgi:glycosyltransferase involved in cell wall biosynthesis